MKSNEKLQPKYQYAGISKSHYIQLLEDGMRAYGAGSLFKVAPKKDLKNKFIRKLVHTTPTQRYQDGVERNVLCRCAKTNALYRFIGRVQFVDAVIAPKEISPDVPGDSVSIREGDIHPLVLLPQAVNQQREQLAAPNAIMVDEAVPLDLGVAESASDNESLEKLEHSPPIEKSEKAHCSDGTKARGKADNLAMELECILAMRKAGMNPMVRIRHVCALLGLSRATVYRRIEANELAKQTKQGRSSIWYLSQIESYLDIPEQQIK